MDIGPGIDIDKDIGTGVGMDINIIRRKHDHRFGHNLVRIGIDIA